MSYKLAVIIPCWNCSKVIGPMLESIQRQTFSDWKVFCVDDKSTDNTALVINKYSAQDKRILYVERNREPKGAQTCRNMGVDLSEGAEYVIWFDSDDIIAPYCFEQRVTYMEQHQDLDFSIFKAKTFIDGTNEKEGGSLYGYKFGAVDDLSRFLRQTIPFAVWTNIYRRQALINSGVTWDERILSLQDSDFNIQSILKGMRYEYSKDTLIDYFWRVNHSSNSISKNISSDAHKRSHLYYLNKLHNTLPPKIREEKWLELDDYLFFFLDKFHNDSSFVESVLSFDWMKSRAWFGFRIRIYCHHNQKYCKYLLFPIISVYKCIYMLRSRITRKLQMIDAQKRLLSV